MLYLSKRKIKTKGGKASTRYYIRGICQYTGEDVRESLGTGDRSTAGDLFAIELEKRRQRGLHGDAGSSTFAECVVHYLSKGRSDRFLDRILDEIGLLQMREITDKVITDLIAKLYPTAKASTVVRQVYAPIEAVWNEACLAVPPMATPRKFQKPTIKRATPKFARSDDHLQAVLREIERPARRAGVLFMSFSGARASEVAAVLPDDYDPEAGTVLLRHTKNDDPRLVALPTFVNDVLMCLEPRRDEPLFGFADRFALYKEVKRASRRAGVPFLSPHKLGRHTFAARFLRSPETNLASLKAAGGWKSINAVMVYAHLEKSEVDRQVRNVSTTLDTAQSRLTGPKRVASQKLKGLKRIRKRR